MAVAEIEVRGLNELIRSIRRTEPELIEVLKDINVEIAEIAARHVRSQAPRRSGDLAGSVRVGRTARSSVVKVGNARRVPYAGPINYGWRARNIAPNPFIERAKERAVHEILPLAEQRLQQLADRVQGV